MAEAGDAAIGKNQIPVEPAVFTGSDKRMRFDSMKAAHVAIAFEAAGADCPQYVPTQLMQTILGEWDRAHPGGRNLASRLARSISEQDLAHSFNSFHVAYQGTGLFGVRF